jgi:ATP-dependent Clp protease ATP-binding subunit ClpC
MAVIRMMGQGVESGADAEGPAFTGPAEDAIELARRQASRRGQDQVGTEHLLLALVQERNGAAVRILLGLDADPDAIRAALPS